MINLQQEVRAVREAMARGEFPNLTPENVEKYVRKYMAKD